MSKQSISMNESGHSHSKSVIIRQVKADDKEAVRLLIKTLHEKTTFGHMPFCDHKFDTHAERILAKPEHMAAIVAEHKGRIIGFTWATVGQHTISQEGLIATCHVIAVEASQPETSSENGIVSPIAMGHMTRRATTFLRLLKAIKLWSKTRGAEHLMVHITTGGEKSAANAKAAERLLQKVAGTYMGGTYLV